MAHPNEILLRKGYDAFGKGDLETLRAMFAPDVVWHVAGKSALSGSYKGLDEVFGFFAEIVQRSGGTFANEVHDIVAGDAHAIALTTARAEREGRRLHNPGVGIFHIKNGKVTEAWLTSQDQYAADEFWA
ncbi:MAG TPA: nuclear transport factor 2 family protein [Actinomycetota bacterium]